MQLQATGQSILSQIFDLTQQLNDAEYTSELDLLNGNTIGKHVRHILEFFGLLVEGASAGIINYDKRKHEPLFETNTAATLKRIEELMDLVGQLHTGNEVYLEVSYAKSDADSVKIKSSVERELAYNIEHSIHHMAIIKIAIQTVFPNIQVAENFGVAYSTVRYQRSTRH
jgi:uncharacterized damage-inducible protein DinB